MKLPPIPQNWLEPWRSMYLERWAIMQYDGGMTEAEAQRAAAADIRKQAERE